MHPCFIGSYLRFGSIYIFRTAHPGGRRIPSKAARLLGSRVRFPLLGMDVRLLRLLCVVRVAGCGTGQSLVQRRPTARV